MPSVTEQPIALLRSLRDRAAVLDKRLAEALDPAADHRRRGRDAQHATCLAALSSLRERALITPFVVAKVCYVRLLGPKSASVCAGSPFPPACTQPSPRTDSPPRKCRPRV
jgi:hypothetical protein